MEVCYGVVVVVLLGSSSVSGCWCVTWVVHGWQFAQLHCVPQSSARMASW